MGKNGKNSKRGHRSNGRDNSETKKKWHSKASKTKAKWNRRSSREAFWIEDAPESNKPAVEDERPALWLRITRVQLEDDYRQTNLLTTLQCNESFETAPATAEVSQDRNPDESTEQSQHDDGVGTSVPDDPAKSNDRKLPQRGENDGTVDIVDMESVQRISTNKLNDADGTLQDGSTPTKLASLASETAAKHSTETVDTSTVEPSSAASDVSISNHNDTVNLNIIVKRTSSAKGRAKRYHNDEDFKPLPNGDCGDGVVNPLPKEVCPDKFWSQRRRLFSRFDEGIQLDKQSWYSVTPEVIANHIAKRITLQFPNRNNLVVLDPFCGCGGNSIAFARRPEVSKVICVDMDKSKLEMARANAHIYDNADNKMIFINADACAVLRAFSNGTKIRAGGHTGEDTNTDTPSSLCGLSDVILQSLPHSLDAVFLSPPWGGASYLQVGKRNYDLTHIQIGTSEHPVDGTDLLRLAVDALKTDRKVVAYFLPRNTNGIRLARNAAQAGIVSGAIDMEQNLLNGKLKTVTAYFGV